MAHQRIKNNVCTNCGYRFDQLPEHTNFCPECGQENHNVNVPLRHLFDEFIESIFHFDTKSIRTLKTLVLKPGSLTVEFNQGRRVRYVQPVRLYVFISFLFFLMISVSSVDHEETPGEASQPERKTNGLGITFKGLNSRDLSGMNDAALDSAMRAQEIEASAFNRYIVRKIARIGSGGEREFSHMIIRGISYMMFVLMPFFALLVFIFYRKRAGNYISMLVYSLHYHSFTFLLLTALTLLSSIPFLSSLPLLMPIVLAVYLYLSLRTVFTQSRLSAIFKTLIIGILHIASVTLLFLITVFTSILLF